jgi:hypothetical protein
VLWRRPSSPIRDLLQQVVHEGMRQHWRLIAADPQGLDRGAVWQGRLAR